MQTRVRDDTRGGPRRETRAVGMARREHREERGEGLRGGGPLHQLRRFARLPGMPRDARREVCAPIPARGDSASRRLFILTHDALIRGAINGGQQSDSGARLLAESIASLATTRARCEIATIMAPQPDKGCAARVAAARARGPRRHGADR